MALSVGEEAPDFAAESSQGKVTLKQYRGQWVVVYFYPKAFTPGCTKEARAFRDNYPDLQALNVAVVGVSIDDAQTQCAFGEATGARFPLVADTAGAITRAYDVKWALLPVAKRVTFIIDPEGRVAKTFHHELQVLKHMDNVLGYFRELQKTGAMNANLLARG